MCGIVGIVGKSNADAATFLVNGLERLEYRGYDSAGVAVLQDDHVETRKRVGRLSELNEALSETPVSGHVGIGHTRWATHGEPSTVNSHPHMNTDGTLAVVHNGIIENYQEIKEELIGKGRRFQSDTDTEVIAQLLDDMMKENPDQDRMNVIREALSRFRGAYALGILFQDCPDRIYCARKGSPLIIGLGDGETYIASDVPAIIQHVKKVIYLDEGEVAEIERTSVRVLTLDGTPVEHEPRPVTFKAEDAEMAGFETYMLKEIHEQPRILRELYQRHVSDHDQVKLPDLQLSDDYFRKLNRIMIVACGTAYHAGMYGKLLLEQLTNIAVETDLASEFRYRDPRIDPGTLLIAISQSGETADTLASVRMAKEWGCRVLSICNVDGSTLVRESDAVFFTRCGPEIGVASTKAYSGQIMAFILLGLHIGRQRKTLVAGDEAQWLNDLRTVPDAMHYVIESKDAIREVAEKHHDGPSSLYLGRKFNFPTALEGALKNKEISYQHAEGYAAGEMKHGPIALINEYLPVICICTKTRDEVYEKMLSNMKEVEARHGRIIALATAGDRQAEALAEDILYVPEVRDEFSPVVNAVALQLLAYYSARARGTDIDKPRNLAKSVTVE